MKKTSIVLILSILIQFLPSEIHPFINTTSANSELIFTVNSYQDVGTADVTSTVCNSVNTNCTLRSAIQQAAHIRYNPNDYPEIDSIKIDISNVISNNPAQIISQTQQNPYHTRPNLFDENTTPLPLEITGNPDQNDYLTIRLNHANSDFPVLPSLILYDNVSISNLRFIDALPVIRGSNVSITKNSLGIPQFSSPTGIPGIGRPLSFNVEKNLEQIEISNNIIRGDITLINANFKVENINISDNNFEFTINHAVYVDLSTDIPLGTSSNLTISENSINNSIAGGTVLQQALVTVSGVSNVNILNNNITDFRNESATKGILINNPMNGLEMTNINIINNHISKPFQSGGVAIQIGTRGDTINQLPNAPFTETNNIIWNTDSNSHINQIIIHNNTIENHNIGIANLKGLNTQITQDSADDFINTSSNGVPIYIDPLYTWLTLVDGIIYKIQDNTQLEQDHLITPILINEEYEKRFYQSAISDLDLIQKMPTLEYIIHTGGIDPSLFVGFNFPNEIGLYEITVYQKLIDPDNNNNIIIRPFYSETFNFVEPNNNSLQIPISNVQPQDANKEYAIKATKLEEELVQINNSSEIGCFVLPNQDNLDCPEINNNEPSNPSPNTDNILSSDQINITILNNDQISISLSEEVKDEFDHPSTQIRFFKTENDQPTFFYNYDTTEFDECSNFDSSQGVDIGFIMSCSDNLNSYSQEIEPTIYDTSFNFLDRNSNNEVKHGYVIFNIELLKYKIGYIEISSTYLRLTNSTYDQSNTLDQFDINGINYIQVSDLIKADNQINNETVTVTLIVNGITIETFEISEVNDTGYFNGEIDTTTLNINLTDTIEISVDTDSTASSNVAFSHYNENQFNSINESQIVINETRSPYFETSQNTNMTESYFMFSQINLESKNIYTPHQNGLSILIQIENLNELDLSDPNPSIPFLKGPAVALVKNYLDENENMQQAIFKADLNINSTNWERHSFMQSDFVPLDLGFGTEGEIFDNFWTEGRIDELYLMVPMESGVQTVRFKDVLFNYLPNHTLSRSYATTGQESEDPTDPTDPTDPEDPTDPADPEDPTPTTGSITQTTISSGSKPCRINPDLCDEEELKTRGIIEPTDSNTEKEYSRKSSDELTYEQLVKLMLDLGIVTKEPFKYANRCELAVMLTRIHQFNTQDNIERIFIDTPEWCTNQATELHNREITFGLSNNFYGANQLITENEVSTILKRLKGIHLPEYSFTYKFNRFSPIQDWAMSSASWFRENSLFKLTNQVSVFQKHKYIKKVDAAIIFWKNKYIY